METVIPTPVRAVIAFAGYTRTKYVRGSRSSCDMYIYGVSWGKGSTITKYTFGPDRSRACFFGSATAADLGKQLVERFRNVDVRVIVGDRVETIAPTPRAPIRHALSAVEQKYLFDIMSRARGQR